MVAALYGHSSKAQRASVLCSVKASQHAGSGCADPRCVARAAGCMGNTYTTSEQGNMQMVVNHHKTSSRGSPGLVLSITSPKEVDLLQLWELYGRPVVLCGKEEDTGHMFLTKGGQPFTDNSFIHWWTQLHR